MKKKIIENIKTIFYALFIAVLIRSLFFQPFYIPSSSMEPNLLVGDRLFASKFSYGYSRHSFPFSPNIFKNRVLEKKPKIGDIIIFKTPADNRTDYIKRLIGLPGDRIIIQNGKLFINDNLVKRKIVGITENINCGSEVFKAEVVEETLPNGVKHKVVYRKDGTMLNTDLYIVPKNHYFFMGDNRDCSKDSRFLSSVGYVNFTNLVGKAKITFFSNDRKIAEFYEFWKWHKSIRLNKIFKKIK